MTTRYLDQSLERLSKFLGKENADKLVADCLKEMGQSDISKISDPQLVLEFSSALSKRAGVAEVVGRSVRTYALSLGARLSADEEKAVIKSVKMDKDGIYPIAKPFPGSPPRVS